MQFAEVIAKDKQRDGGFQVFPLAGKSIRQARKSSHSHSHCQISPFDVRRANHIAVRIAEPRLNDRALQFGRRVARRAVRHSGVNLYQLTIINPRSEAQTDSVRIRGHAISRELKLSDRGLIQFFNKDFSVEAATSAKMPRENDLAMALNSKERP